MKNYKQHLNDTLIIKNTSLINRKPVFSGSAIFPVLQSKEISTRILFMGYWIVKKSIDQIGLLITLRNKEGKLIERHNEQIVSPISREIKIENLLDNTEYFGKNFKGSIELEIFSSVDLVFPYPAFVVNYYNEFSSAVVHTTGRVFKDIETLANSKNLVKEAGFDVIGNPNIKSFFTFVNGGIEIDNSEIEVEIINSLNKIVKKKIQLGRLAKYEMCFVVLNDYFDLASFLNGEMGTVKIKHSFISFFPRFIAGNLQINDKAIGVTHTFYDNSKNEDESAYWENSDSENFYDSAIFIPLLLNDKYYTHLKLYPIYSPSNHSIDLVFYSEKGVKLLEINDFKIISKDFNHYETLDFDEILSNNFEIKHQIKGVQIIKKWETKNKIPNRLKYGLNIGIRNKQMDIPTNICFASQISNPSILLKKGTFKWFPLIGNSGSFAVIQNAGFVKNYNIKATCEITYYSSVKENIFSETIELAPNSIFEINYSDKLKKQFDNKTIWITINANSPFVNAWYFTTNKSGVMGGDHSF